MNSDSTAKLPVWMAWCGLALTMAYACHLAFHNKGIDYYHFWGVPQFEQAGLNFSDIYNPYSHPNLVDHLDDKSKALNSSRLDEWIFENDNLYDTGFHPTGTPFFYSANRYLVAPDHPEFGFKFFQVLALFAFAVGSILLSRSFGANWFWAVTITACFLLLHRGLHSDIKVANINRLQFGFFGCTIWFWLTGGSSLTVRSAIVGFLYGLLIMYKPNTLLVMLPAVAMFFDRQFSLLGGFILGAIGGMLIGLSCVLGAEPFEGWEAWQKYMDVTASQPFALESGNYALSRLANDSQIQVIAIGLALSLIGIVFGVIGHSRQVTNSDAPIHANRYTIIACLGLVIPLISGPLAWGHYLVLSIPLAVAILFSNATTRRLQVLSGVGLLLCGAVAVSRIPGVPGWLLLISIQCGLSILFACGLILLYRLQSNSQWADI